MTLVDFSKPTRTNVSEIVVMGGAVFAGAWLENGDTFDAWELAGSRTNGGVGLVMDTLIGPVLVAGAWSFDGRWRTYLGVGRIFR
jgi:NTE family protein